MKDACIKYSNTEAIFYLIPCVGSISHTYSASLLTYSTFEINLWLPWVLFALLATLLTPTALNTEFTQRSCSSGNLLWPFLQNELINDNNHKINGLSGSVTTPVLLAFMPVRTDSK